MCDVRYSQVYTTVNATTRSLRKGTLGIAFLQSGFEDAWTQQLEV